MTRCKVAAVLLGVVLTITVSSQAALVDVDTGDSGPALSGGVVVLNAEPMVVQTHTVTMVNETDFTWTSFIWTLDPAEVPTFVDGSGQSTDFNTAVHVDEWTIEFLSPLEVPPGETVTFEFKLNVPAAGGVPIVLTQSPIPEPATMLLFGLGTLGLAWRRER